MKTSKVEKIEKVVPWSGANGTVLYHALLMENGDKINIGKKKELAIGQELEYEITETPEQAKGEYLKAKTPKKDFVPNSGGGGFSKDPLTQFYIIGQSCQDRAVKIVCNDADNVTGKVEVERIEGITKALMTQVIKLATEFSTK